MRRNRFDDKTGIIDGGLTPGWGAETLRESKVDIVESNEGRSRFLKLIEFIVLVGRKRPAFTLPLFGSKRKC
jgi:hypothetical protein